MCRTAGLLGKLGVPRREPAWEELSELEAAAKEAMALSTQQGGAC